MVDGKVVPNLEMLPQVNAHIIYSQNPICSYGFLEKNLALDIISEDVWVYFLDDDTTLHANFNNLFLSTITEKPDVKGMVFAQLLPDGRIRTTLPGLNHYLGKIDMCQYVIRRGAIKYHRFFSNFGSDGEFFTRIYNENRDYFVFKSEVATNHNDLRLGELYDPDHGHGRAY